MEQAKISVIIPVYNVEMYLEECLNSILKQDFEDYEIICVNDASTDSSENILLNYREKYEKIKIITHEKNKGLSAARNTGVLNAIGKYILFIDSDDLIVENTFTELYDRAEQTASDIVYFNMVNFYEEETSLKRIYQKTQTYIEYAGVYSGKELFCLFMDSHNMNVQAVRKFIRKKFLEEKEIKFYEGILHEDVLFSFLCAMNAKKVMNINKEYYIRRLRKESITHTKNNKKIQSLFVIMIQILTYWNTHSFSEKENQAIEYYFQEIYKLYQRYNWQFEQEKIELEVGGEVEKAVYSILYGKHKNRWVRLNENQLSKISKAEHVIVFGAGAASMDIVNILKERNIKIDVIAVSDIEENPKLFCGINVDAIDNIIKNIKNGVVIIGATEKYQQEIKDKLIQLGYNDIITPEKYIENR
ncbi:MAG: glycosyltransferase [Lachnospiraceae bacterium]|nr:glycosyltransferase [Lachnospiraceae bacterium]